MDAWMHGWMDNLADGERERDRDRDRDRDGDSDRERMKGGRGGGVCSCACVEVRATEMRPSATEMRECLNCQCTDPRSDRSACSLFCIRGATKRDGDSRVHVSARASVVRPVFTLDDPSNQGVI